MLSTKAFATDGPTSPLKSFSFDRREVKDHDVLIEILYSGVCHSDIHQARNEWGGSIYPMVPGHEMVGRVTKVGSKVKNFKIGDIAGVGCMVDSCRKCSSCHNHMEQFCEVHTSYSYNGTEQDKKTPTYGGYSSQVVVDESFTLKVSPNLPLERVAPLLCAGITTYSPLKHWKVCKGQKVAVAGLGGLGHMGIKFAVAMGAEVTVFSTNPSKEADARHLGAKHYVNTKSPDALAKLKGYFNLILDTISAEHDLTAYLQCLKTDGVLNLVGIPDKAAAIHASTLITGRKVLTGSLIGGIKETQEMLDYCAEKEILSDIELIPIQDINLAYERMLKGDVKYRFVIDMKSL
jgi:uncharacterized zinc-type alcohol dehydrogenase-like protein